MAKTRERRTTSDQRLHGGYLLYWLLYLKLFHYFPPFRIFRYLTFRTAFASLTALFTGLIVGPLVIERLRQFQIGQYIREEGPQAHQKKAGTPTMGGLLIAISIIVPTLLWADLSNPFVWIAVLSTSAFAAIGFADDYIKVVHRRNLGLTARAKLGLQILTSSLMWCQLSNPLVLILAHTRQEPRRPIGMPDDLWAWYTYVYQVILRFRYLGDDITFGPELEWVRIGPLLWETSVVDSSSSVGRYDTLALDSRASRTSATGTRQTRT